MKIAAITLVRDAAKYIVPHLKMYTGVTKNIALFIPQQLAGGSSGHSGNRDNSLELIKQYCPEVEVHETNYAVWDAGLFNRALELAGDCDKVVMFHADVVFSPEMWERLKKILESPHDIYYLNMPKCTINYYHDFEHGVRDCLDTEPIAVAADVRFNGIYGIPNRPVFTIDKNFEVHHFTGWKGIFATKEWLHGEVPSESRIYINQLKPETGWIPCPSEVRKLFV